MGRLTPESEAYIRKECAGRGMVPAHFIYALVEEIRALERERRQLSQLLFQRENYWRNLEGKKDQTNVHSAL
jgi:hypothetical protein